MFITINMCLSFAGVLNVLISYCHTVTDFGRPDSIRWHGQLVH